MNLNKTIIIAAGFSVFVHGILLSLSPHIIMPGMNGMMDETDKIFRIQNVEDRPYEVDLFNKKAKRTTSVKMSRKMQPVDFKLNMEKMNGGKEAEPKDVAEGVAPADMEKFLSRDMERTETKNEIRTEINKLKKEIEPERKVINRNLISERLVKNVITTGKSTSEIIYLSENSEPPSAALQADKWSPGESADFNVAENESGNKGKVLPEGEYKDISPYLDIIVNTYEDKEAGDQYFEITIKAKKDADLIVMPKEVIFLIDSSKSITEEKLDYMKEGLARAIRSLGKKDIFNIVAFRGDLVKFKRNSVPATDKNIDQAILFVSGLKAVGQTDVENALLGIIKEPVRFNPSYIVLVTDGRPTTGMLNSRSIVQEITRANKKTRPIFCFGGGRRVNKYLLDFISYQNRAWSYFSETTFDIKNDFSRFYNEINRPVLLNVHYHLLGVEGGQVFPKSLSDFYLGRTFKLYGKYVNEDEFSVQVLGEMNGEVNEFIFKRSLKNAEKGTSEIAKEWAFRKIYYLISENTLSPEEKPSLLGEISELSKKYGIETPYNVKDLD